ncbi:hypothetical protein JCM3774_006795 [Rhodotorula dairenensis]
MWTRVGRPAARAATATVTAYPRPATPRAVVVIGSGRRRLPHLVSARHYARQPAFTTPDEQGGHAASEHERVSPHAQQVLDSYASPFAASAASAYSLFRYAVFASVFLVASSLAAFTAVHLYVEHVALAGPAPNCAGPDNDPDEWAEEAHGWTGLHTPNRGGTDPRLGLWTRMAIRAAWMSQHWGSGTVAAPESGPAAASSSSSPFAVAAPRRIGDANATAANGGAGASVDPAAARQVHDAGWIMAERYLAQALRRAAETRGISLVDSRDWEAHVDHGGVDRAAVELEERLAGIRERIGGRARLDKARQGWERIYYALEASPSDPTSHAREAKWEQLEKLRATRKLAELSARIADSWRPGSDERAEELERAEGWFLGGLIPALADAEGQSLAGKALDRLVPGGQQARDGDSSRPPDALEPPRKHVSPSSSFFGFWSRSHPPATPSAATTRSPASLPPAIPTAELDHLVALLSSAAAATSTSSSSDSTAASALLSPASQRAVVATLVSLETHLARRASTSAANSSSSSSSPQHLLERAQALQTAALEYTRSLARARPLLPASVPPPVDTALTPADLSRKTTALWLSTRLAALETHLSECRLALALSATTTSGARKNRNNQSALPVDLADAEALLGATSRAEQTSDAAAAILAALETSQGSSNSSGGGGGGASAKQVRQVYEEPLKRVRRDADRVVEMGTALSELVAGLLSQNKDRNAETSSSQGWFK